MARAGEGGAELAGRWRSSPPPATSSPPISAPEWTGRWSGCAAEQERARTLSDVRAQWGDGPVDLVLQRERAVLDLWGVTGR